MQSSAKRFVKVCKMHLEMFRFLLWPRHESDHPGNNLYRVSYQLWDYFLLIKIWVLSHCCRTAVPIKQAHWVQFLIVVGNLKTFLATCLFLIRIVKLGNIPITFLSTKLLKFPPLPPITPNVHAWYPSHQISTCPGRIGQTE